MTRLACASCWNPRGEQRSRAGHPARRRAHSANGRATDTTAYRCSTVCIFSQLARRSTALPSPLASARYSHRAGCAMASSVTMRPRESLRFVTEAHRHLSPVREAGCASQPQRRGTAIAESHQMKACASQDDSQSAVALGVGLGSLAHRGWLPSSTAVGHPQLRQSYITPHCIKCMASQSQAPFVSPHRFAPFGFTQQALCKIAFAGAVVSRRRSPVASRPTRRRLSPWWCAGAVAYVRRFAHCSGQRPTAKHLVFAPAHPWVLLASQHRPRGLPVRPPRGLPQNRAKTRRLTAVYQV